MLGRLIHESADDGLEIGLVSPVVGTINIRDLRSFQDRLEDCRAHGARHAGEGKDIDDPIEAMQAVLQGATNT